MQNLAKIVSAHGGTTAFARTIGAPVGTVSAWISRNRIPTARVPDVERATGIPRHTLRPDIWGETEPQSFASPRMGQVAVTIPQRTVEFAADLNLDVARLLATIGLAAVRKELNRVWDEQNAEAIKARNTYFEKHGLPLEKYRTW